MTEPLTIFVHIPKTAGRTLRTIIRRQYRPEQVFITRGEAGNSFQEFLSLSAEEQARVQIVQGHFPYGLHDHISRPAVYVTMLREPIARVISYYRFVRDHPEHANHAAVIEKGLAGFVKDGAFKHVDNAQLRYLAASQDAPFGACTEEMFEAALAHLEQRFVAVGLVEAFDDSILFMRRALGWRLPVYRSINVSKHRLQDDELTDELLALLREQNRFDLRLYDYARQRFQETMRAQGIRLAWDRRYLAVMNRIYAYRTEPR